MKKINSSFRLQIIKEAALRQRIHSSGDPMTRHISDLLDCNQDMSVKSTPTFSDNHYDEHAGGWVSDLWHHNNNK